MEVIRCVQFALAEVTPTGVANESEHHCEACIDNDINHKFKSNQCIEAIVNCER